MCSLTGAGAGAGPAPPSADDPRLVGASGAEGKSSTTTRARLSGRDGSGGELGRLSRRPTALSRRTDPECLMRSRRHHRHADAPFSSQMSTTRSGESGLHSRLRGTAVDAPRKETSPTAKRCSGKGAVRHLHMVKAKAHSCPTSRTSLANGKSCRLSMRSLRRSIAFRRRRDA